MKLVVDGVLDQNLPWALIGIGVGIALVAALVKVPVLAFAVGVSRQNESGCLLNFLGNLLHMLFVLLDELIFHREAFAWIDCAFFGDEVANMSVRRKNVKVLAEVLLNCSRLGGRFDYE